ncbi:MAG: hypothetical protein G01um101456_19 [Parcubacteria group bacterium Gr01-1014_56]|nr:MAG: hypothetical protein G01um101456_19 [Parcubacteria group bacterium Gr01-1014_56]
MKSTLTYALAALACAGVFFLLYMSQNLQMPSAKNATRSIEVEDTTIIVEVADTESSRERGLSGRRSLLRGNGMLFVFESGATAGIWMKDMQFPIDIIWINASSTVITIAHDVSPDTYPNIFYPSSPARYVLEVPAGFAKQIGVAEGTKIVL